MTEEDIQHGEDKRSEPPRGWFGRWFGGKRGPSPVSPPVSVAVSPGPQNGSLPDSHGTAAHSGNGRENDVSAEDAATKEILKIIQFKYYERNTKGFGKWFWIALPVVFIFGRYFDMNMRHFNLLTYGIMSVMFAIRGYELLIGVLVKRGWLTLQSLPTRMIPIHVCLFGFLAGCGIWGAVFIAVFNFHY